MEKQKRTDLILLSVLVLLVLAGGALRLYKLDDKEFWHDESFTALVLSGHTSEQVKASVSAAPCTFDDLAPFKTVTSNSTPANLVKVIGADEPGHAPLFYFLEYAFCSLFGTTPYTMRLLCALIGTATIPVFYWLALRIYESRSLAVVTAGLASLSPLLIYYAQEARDYSLGIFFMVLSTALLLQALQSNRKLFWIAYSTSMVLGLYSWLFMTVVGAGHLLYVLITMRTDKTKLKAFALSVGIASIFFAPWLLFITQHMQEFKKAYDWMQPALSVPELVTVWLAIPYKALALFGFKTAKLGLPLLIVTLVQLTALVLALVPYRNKKYCLLAIIAIWVAIFAGQDIFTGGARSAVFRYQIPVVVAMLIIYPTILEKSFQRSKLIQAFAALLIGASCGVELVSDAYMLNCKIWPDKAIRMRFTLPIANRLNSDDHAILLLDENSINLTELIDLSYITNPKIQMIYRSSGNPQAIPEECKTLYLWNPSPELESNLRKMHYEIIDNLDNFPYFKLAQRT